MHQPAPGKAYQEPNISVQGQRLKDVNKFTYLGSTLSRNIIIDNEVCARIAKASSAFGKLYPDDWNRAGITMLTKLNVYKAIVIPILLYACETWTVYKRHAKCVSKKTP